MLVEELKNSLVSTLILLAHLRVLQVRPSSHPAVDLSRERLHVLWPVQVRLVILDVLRRLIARGEHCHRHADRLGIVGIHHRGVALRSGLEELVVRARGEGGDLAAPAEAEDGPRLKAAARCELVAFGNDARDLGEGLGWRSFGGEEVS